MAGIARAGAYERGVYQFLAVYRFFTFALAIALEFTLAQETGSATYLILGLLGGYTLLKVIQPSSYYHRALLSRALLGIDLVACLGLTLASGGLDSGLIPYSLSPLLTVSLLYRPWDILPVTVALPLALSLGHLLGSPFTEELPWLLEDNFMSLLVLYSMASLVVVILTRRTNINLYRRIEMDSAQEERRRIARELHDGLAQSLGYLKWRTKAGRDFALALEAFGAAEASGAVEALEDIKGTVDQLYDEVRDSIDWLAAEAQESRQQGLDLAQYVQDLGERVGLTVELAAFGKTAAMSPRGELEMRRILQEALTNVKKHSGVSRATVSFKALPVYDEITVRDEGRGFALDQGQAIGYRGLQMMRERARSLGGNLEVASALGRGTSVTLRLPRDRRR